MSGTDCPSDADLAAFASGEMSASAIDGIAAHLTDCAACRLRLEKLDEQPDDMVLAIRRGTKVGPAPALPSSDSDSGSAEFVPLTAFDHAQAAEPKTEGPGTRIGPYRLLQLLGEGGFGSVFLAEQSEPVRRQVALKLVKLGMDTRQVLARFKAERQALAMMDHPNIARVLDAGATDRGRPYFVMELAKGVAITEYCDTHHVATRTRLELFAEVCGAVQHAHTKGVIHRDLKPHNVLITMRDGKPEPKVIDFGIAKAIGGGRLTDQTLYTELRQFIGTPEYMSPEQADPTALDVDARTDVYSLGVLLYELLTGSTPFDAKTLRSKGIEQIGKMIRETDPPKPSTRIGTLGESLYDVAQRRGTEPRKLASTIKGELDWIVMKCLEKDRTLRYETANALGMDVRRYLADEPVRAGPPSTMYQVRKFVHRHRGIVFAAGAVAGAVLVGLVLAIQGWTRASNARDAAQISERLERGQRGIAEKAVTQLGQAAASRRVLQGDAVRSASPAGAIVLLDALRADAGDDRAALEPVRQRFRDQVSSSLPEELPRIRSACALALLGEPRAEELADAVRLAPASEGPLVIAALRATAASPVHVTSESETLVERMNGAFAAELKLRSRARLAISLLFTGDDAAAITMLSAVADPTPRSAFIEEFGQWHGDLTVFADVFSRVSQDDVLSGLCLAASRVDPDGTDATERKPVIAQLGRLYRESSSGGVHAASGYTLTAWREAKPLMDPERQMFDPARGWYVTPSGLTMIRVPAGANALGRDGEETQPVLFTHPLYVADREVPASLFKQFAEDTAVSKENRPKIWLGSKDQSHDRPGGAPRVAVWMTPAEAMRFCNWLSVRDGRKPCYDMVGPTWETWSMDVDADGYRLPTDPEWEYFTRAGSGTAYACGNAPAYLKNFAQLLMSAPRAGALPSRWGLFDTLGGSWEMTWPVPMGERPSGVKASPEATVRRPVVDPRWKACDRYLHCRGGAEDSGTRDLDSGSQRSMDMLGEGTFDISFRVVCNAVANDAPADVPAPEDLTELWLRASELRPWDDAVAKRGFEYAKRTAHARARKLRFQEAADLFTKACQLKPNDPELLFYVAALRLELNQPKEYRAACMQLLGYSMGSSKPQYIERAAKAMLLDPNVKPGPELYAAEQASRSVELGKNNGLIGWFYIVEGMAQYRAGKYEPAIQTLRMAQDKLRPYDAGRALPEFFIAMAQFRSGDLAGARATYDEAAKVMPPGLDADPNADWQTNWIDWLDSAIAQREAKQLIVGAPAVR